MVKIVDEKEKSNTSLFDDVEMKEVITLEEGKYEGKITDVQRDTEKYDYTRYKIKIKDHDLTLDLSFPTSINWTNDGKPSTQHAKFLALLGFGFKEGLKLSEIVPKTKGMNLSFLVQNKTNDKGTFAEIVATSVKKL